MLVTIIITDILIISRKFLHTMTSAYDQKPKNKESQTLSITWTHFIDVSVLRPKMVSMRDSL